MCFHFFGGLEKTFRKIAKDGINGIAFAIDGQTGLIDSPHIQHFVFDIREVKRKIIFKGFARITPIAHGKFPTFIFDDSRILIRFVQSNNQWDVQLE
ncbi:hypothetical protein D3C73_1323710 [compost metagenome]